MSTTATSDSWWDNIAVFESDYVPATFTPGSSVEANHELLDGLRENDFDTSDTDYTYGLLTLAMVFLVAGVLACVLLPCIYCCLGKSSQERLRERLSIGPKSHYKGNLVMVIASVAAIATASGAMASLSKTDNGLTNIEERTQDIATDLQSILSLPNDTAVVLASVSTAYDALLDGVDGCTGSEIVSGVLGGVVDISDFSDTVQSVIDELNTEALNDLADDVQGVSDAVGDTEGVRKGVVWPAIAIALFLTVIFIIFAVGTYGIIALGVSDCGPVSCVVSPCTVFMAVIIWLSAASAVTLSALSGDFCTDPDSNVETLIIDNSNNDQMRELLLYYTGDCSTDNTAIEVILAVQEETIPVVQETLPILYEVSDACEDLLPAVQLVDGSLEDLWLILEDAAELSSCENLNGLYQQAVYEELCDELPKGLLGFWVSCVILTVLLLILAVQWTRMQQQQATEEEALASEERSRRRAQWMSKNISGRFSSFNSQRASGQPLSSRSSATSSHTRQGALAPTWGVGMASSAYQGSVTSSTSNLGGAPPTQRPVEISNPQRPRRK